MPPARSSAGLPRFLAARCLMKKKSNLGALIYTPESMLGVMLPAAEEQRQWYRETLLRLIHVLRAVSSKYPRAKVRRLIEGEI
jgi:fructose-1,6-bisphosphatase-3